MKPGARTHSPIGFSNPVLKARLYPQAWILQLSFSQTLNSIMSILQLSLLYSRLTRASISSVSKPLRLHFVPSPPATLSTWRHPLPAFVLALDFLSLPRHMDPVGGKMTVCPYHLPPAISPLPFFCSLLETSQTLMLLLVCHTTTRHSLLVSCLSSQESYKLHKQIKLSCSRL